MYIFLGWVGHEGEHDSVVGVPEGNPVVVHVLGEGGRESGGLIVSSEHDLEEGDVLEFVGGGEVCSEVVDGDCVRGGLPVERARVTRRARGTILIIINNKYQLLSRSSISTQTGKRQEQPLPITGINWALYAAPSSLTPELVFHFNTTFLLVQQLDNDRSLFCVQIPAFYISP